MREWLLPVVECRLELGAEGGSRRQLRRRRATKNGAAMVRSWLASLLRKMVEGCWVWQCSSPKEGYLSGRKLEMEAESAGRSGIALCLQDKMWQPPNWTPREFEGAKAAKSRNGQVPSGLKKDLSTRNACRSKLWVDRGGWSLASWNSETSLFFSFFFVPWCGSQSAGIENCGVNYQ